MKLMIQDPTYSGSMKLGEALIDACKLGVNGAEHTRLLKRMELIYF